jgi:mannose-6-phosphate isomerase-like protein (cupin superfamily)
MESILYTRLLMSAAKLAPPLSGLVLGSLDSSFVIAEWKDAGGPASPPRLIAPLHVHFRDDEAWYVLEGKMRVQVGEETVEAHAGSAVLVPRGTPHTYWNAGEDPLRYLLLMTPNIYALIQEIHGLKERTPASLRAVFARHDSELLDA